MSKPNLKSQAKRKRELAKLGKRQAKDEKRALRKAERAGSSVSVTPPAAPTGTKLSLPGAPQSLAEAARRWAESRAPTTKPRR